MWQKNDLRGQCVVVSGATSGIGRAVAQACAERGARLAICGRRAEALAAVAEDLRRRGAAELWAAELDVRDRAAVEAWWASAPEAFSRPAALVNNAGLARGFTNVREDLAEDWEEMVDTNLKGLLWVTRAVLPSLLARGQGHIVNIGSLAGVAAYPKGAVYCATKAAVKTFSDGLRQDLVDTAIKVTTIQPGMVETEFSLVRFHGDAQKAAAVYAGIRPLAAEDVAESVLFALEAPAHVQLCELTLTPVHQATGGVVFRS